MDQAALKKLPRGWKSIPSDLGSDQTAFKGVNWGKGMMWIFLLSDTFIFSCFLLSYMTGRGSTVQPWPNPSEVFALDAFGVPVPLLLIAIMTFVLITSSGTMAMAVKYGYEKNRKLPFGAPQCGAFFFMITGFHGTHVSIGVIFLFIFTRKVFRGDFDTGKKGYFTSMKSDYVAIEILGLYWHFVDLVWVFIFAFFYLW